MLKLPSPLPAVGFAERWKTIKTFSVAAPTVLLVGFALKEFGMLFGWDWSYPMRLVTALFDPSVVAPE